MKKIIIGLALLLLVAAGVYFIFIKKEEENKLTDSDRFKVEYPNVTENNPFVYKSVEEILDIFENGTGIVYFGFKECPWCQAYVVYLEEVAKELNIEKIYYYDIREIRNENTDNYKALVEILKDHLELDDKGNPRIFVPDISVVKNGEIISHDNETSLDTLGFDDPKDYWTNDRIDALKTRLRDMLKEVSVNYCTECN